MMKKIFVLALLSLSLSACEPSSTDNANANKPASTPVAATPAPALPTPEAVASVKPQLKAGDKVKVKINGVATEASVVSVDEKAGKVTVKLPGQKEEKTFAVGDVVKQ